jgi:hypothetical protein
MARAPETGYYFEPLTERLALVVEGSAFPSDDHWAYVGDPIEITAELAKIEVALRWPGVDPDELELEFDTDFDAAVVDAEKLRQELDELGGPPQPQVFDVGVEQLLTQAQALRDAAAETSLTVTREQLEAAAEGRLPGTATEAAPAGEPPAAAPQAAEPPANGPESAPEVVVKATGRLANRVRVRVVTPDESAPEDAAPAPAAEPGRDEEPPAT